MKGQVKMSKGRTNGVSNHQSEFTGREWGGSGSAGVELFVHQRHQQ